jgi:hypothetical protein
MAKKVDKFTPIMALVGVMVGGVIGAVIGPYFQHKLDLSAQNDNLRRTTYLQFISQANSTQNIMLGAYNTMANELNSGKRLPDTKITAYFQQIAGASVAQFNSSKEQVDLIGPSSVASIADSLSSDFFMLEQAYITFLNTDARADNERVNKDISVVIRTIERFTSTAKAAI